MTCALGKVLAAQGSSAGCISSAAVTSVVSSAAAGLPWRYIYEVQPVAPAISALHGMMPHPGKAEFEPTSDELEKPQNARFRSNHYVHFGLSC